MRYTFINHDIAPVLTAIESTNIFALDLETTGLNPLDSRILLCQVGVGDHEYVIDARKVDLKPLTRYLTSSKWLKLIFSKFEDKFFQHFYETQINNLWDCFLAERIITPDSLYNNSFEDLAQKHLDVALNKSVRETFLKPIKDFTEDQIKYAAEDVQYLFPLYELQKAKIEELGLEKIADLEFSVLPAVSRMELTGVEIDKVKWRLLLQEYRDKLQESNEALFKILFDDNDIIDEQLGMFARTAGNVPTRARGKIQVGINLGSPDQVKSALNKLGIAVDKTDERTLEKIKHPAAKELLNHRKIEKVIDSFGENILDKIHPFTGRIHADFKQLGTETGRFSCKEPNLQQMPEAFRACFVSGAGYEFVGADYSQIELRILADISGDAALTAAFKSGHDVHIATAASMFNVPFAEVTKEQRFAAKTLNFGMMYGMGVPKLMDSLNVENEKSGQKKLNIRQVQSIHYRYRQTYKKATDWLESAGKTAIRTGESITMYGRKRFYNRPTSTLDRKGYDKQMSGIERQGANSPIQGTCADITKLAMLNLYNDLKDYGYRGNIVLQVHDEIVVLAHKSQSEPIKTLIEESMTRAAQMVLTKVPVKVDTYISEIWKK